MRSAFALLPLALLAGTGKLGAATYTGAVPGVFDTGTNWDTGVAPGFDSGSTTAVPNTLNNTDTATFGVAPGPTTLAGNITFTDTRNIQNITTSQGSGTLTLGSTTGPALYLTDGGKLLQTGNLMTFAEPMVLEGSYTFDNEASASRITTVSAPVSGTGVAGATLTLTTPYAANNAVTGRIGGATAAAQSLAVVKNGAGTWLIGNTSTGASNNYTGGTTVNTGLLQDSGQSLSTGAFGSGTVTLSGGSLAVAFNSTATANTFNNPLAVTASTTSTLLLRSVNTTLNTTFSAQSVTGTGTLILSPSIGSTGTTTINAGFGTLANGTTASTVGAFGTFGGTLQISPNNTTNGTASLNITNAAALASTTGTVNITTGGILTSNVANINSGSAVTVAGGTLTPNGTGVGMLTLTGNKNFSMTSGTLGLTLTSTAAGSFDQIVGGGTSTFSLTGGTLDLGGAAVAANTSYQVLTGFASGNVSGLTITDYTPMDGSLTATLDNTGLLSFTAAAVPEPGACVQMGCLAVGGLAFAAKRRRMASR